MYDEVGTCGIRVLISSCFCFQEVQGFTTVGEMERFLLEHGEQIVDVLGSEVDRIEDRIKVRVVMCGGVSVV